MIKRFIVLIDFSENSECLMNYASDWSQKVNAEILFVHKTIVLVPALADNKSRNIITKNANDVALARIMSLANKIIAPEVKVSFWVSEIDLQVTLTNLLAASYNNLILVGLKGTGLLKKIFIGSIALDVMENVNNIVVAIPKNIITFLHRKIFVAVSEKHPFDVLQLDKFLQFTDDVSRSITFFYMSTQVENVEGIEGKLADLATMYANRFESSYIIYKGINPFEDVRKVINNKIDELLIVQKGSRLLTDQLFRRFLINDLVYEGQTPLIVLP